MCVTDCLDMTLAVKVVLNPNTTNQPTILVEMRRACVHSYEIMSESFFTSQNFRLLLTKHVLFKN